MFKKFIHKSGFLGFYILVAIALEVAMFLRLGIGVLPKYWLYDFSIILMIAGIIFIIPNHIVQAVVTAIMLGVQCVLFYVNYTLYTLYGDVFSVDMINLFHEAVKAITKDFSYVWIIVALVCAYIAIVFCIVRIAIQQGRRKISFRHNFSLAVVMMLLITQGIACSAFMAQRERINSTGDIVQVDKISDKFLMDTSMLKIASLKTFGFFGYYTNNLMNTVWRDGVSEQFLQTTISYFNNGETHDQNSSELFGADQDNNVIMIMLESLEWFAFCDGTENSRTLSSELTPTIYSLIEQGFVADNFFAKSKTNISEGIGFVGSYPIGKYMEQVTRHSDGSQYDFTLPNVLRKQGYSTAYFHTNESSYYDRHKTHTKLGFDNIYCWDYDEFGFDGGYKWGNWVKEEDFVYAALDYMIPTTSNKAEYGENAQKFFTFYTTVSTHGPYDTSSNNADQEEYREYVKYGATKDLPIEQRQYTNWYKNVLEAYGDEGGTFIERLVNYEAAVVGLDKAVEVLVNRLEEYGIYDDTTIILYADHNAYYHGLSNTIKNVPAEEYMDVELNTIPLIIKSSGIAEHTNAKGESLISTSRFCSAYDLVPTVLDLLGIKFNKRLYVGNSLFSPIEDVFEDEAGNVHEMIVYYSLTGGLISQNVYTLNMNSFSYNMDATVAELEKFKQVSTKMLKQLNYVYTLYLYNVYQYIVPVG